MTQHAAQLSNGVNFFQTELMVEIYSKNLVRAIGEARIQIKPMRVMKNGLCLKTTNCFGGPHQ